MALQQFAHVFCLMIVLLCEGCNSQQPACGRPAINSRIAGGQDAAPGRWPWHALIKLSAYSDFCQGSLITDQWVLTSISCVGVNDLNGSVVLLGVQNQTASNPNEVTRRIDQVICHENYLYSTKENDICLVKLSAPVDFTAYIQPICLASENSTFYDGTSSWVTGFGYNENYTIPDTLQEINIPVIGNNECNCFYKDHAYYYYYYTYYYFNYYFYYNFFFFFYNFPITENMICAGNEDGIKRPFSRDQGAPLVTKKDSVWVQSGIVIITDGSQITGPSIYTRVSQYQKWISDRVTGMEPGFVTFNSPGNDSDSTYTCPTPAPTTTSYPTSTRANTPYPTHDPYPNTYPNPYPTTTTTPTTTPYPTYDPYPNTYPNPYPTTDDSVFGSGENLIPFTHFLSLSVLVLFLHVFVGSGGFF